ncbi:uncharacterized protein N7498_000173 [Penicillium cinerascens]|uniref:DNA mismatch repair protein S5 domain-containing protein n=1 Tax=Penicillium cinerascens TaxID=70096 RepID=A0A9W9TD60_9EURO|nr:uncharacterized protein N7498_000173 [Penicillium cinerascens]KAJ5218074.1 hypothetical protein N7498_000173 [Penicillium cinerascens]
MPIEALPQTTVRAIGSTSVISDPCSVVKELIDNALDASATSLQVEISQNTLDVIQLKDNGHGIPTEDHPSVCKHTFTSKIQTVDDLKNVGGTSFGFRGEALASVAEMSGGVTVTTRSASEVTGTCLKYARDGSLSSSARTSHPAGTTMRITDFLKYIPVRRQTALKDATKTLAKFKGLLQSYAFAHPTTRFSIKVLKAKNENNNWMYVPSPDAGIVDAAMRIVGRDVSSCCVVQKLPSESSDQSGYDALAFLPKAGAEIAKANNQGQFFSVDGRPLSTSRGIGQDATRLFKSYVRAAASGNEAAKSISDPFLCLKLKCPRGTYDVNIEPGKDDVLFEDREMIISMIESLFRDYYGPLPDTQKRSPKKAQKPSSNTSQRDSGFDILMSRTRPEIASSQPCNFEGPISVAPASPLSQRANQYSDPLSPDYFRDSGSQRNPGDRMATTESRGSRFINPWSISRINASFQTPQKQRVPQSSGSQAVIQTPQHNNSQQNAAPGLDYQSPPESPEVTSFSALRPATVSPEARQCRPRPTSESLPEAGSTVNSVRKAARRRDKERYGNGALDTLFQRTTGASLAQDPPQPESEQEVAIPTLSQLAQERFQPQAQAESTNNFTDLENRDPGHDASEDPDSQTSPDDDGNLPPGQNQDQDGSMDSGRGFPVLEKWAASLHQDFGPEKGQDLAWALDFERRKREVNQRNRTRSGGRDGQQKPQQGASSGPSPHKNRYLAAKAALTAERPSVVEAVSKTSLSPHDPRAYFMHHPSQPGPNEGSKGSAKLRRLHTSRLPFESTPEEYDIHSICLPVSSDLPLISHLSSLSCPFDAYTQSGKETDVFPESDRESVVSFWNERLISIIKENYKTNDTRYPEWQVDLASVMAKHLN